MTHVLIIAADAAVRLRLADDLRKLRYRVTSAGCGRDGMLAAIRQHPDLILLDLDLQDINGLDVLKSLRASDSTPVVVAVSAHDERRAVLALREGADDCVDKPFSIGILDARLSAVARRWRASRELPVLHVGELTIDQAAYLVQLGSRTLHLRPMEFKLLTYLATREGRIVSKRELQREVWVGASDASNRTLDVHLTMLRRQLGESAARPRYLHSFRGVGVKLHAPPSVQTVRTPSYNAGPASL
ncbi:response regulator transcription factor [Streptomyces vinaceus]|uniref:response regulator transcription factor n=1 Tax=Streptomyces vinaceus TaxID=1960 RepID=UPI0035DBB6B8